MTLEFAERKDFVSVQTLRTLAHVSLALGQFAAERLPTTDTRLNRRYSFQNSLIQATVYFLFKKCLNERVRAVINSLLWGGVQGRWCEVVQQVEATAEHMPSGNQAALLYRDSGVIISQFLLLLRAGVSHKHHLPEEAAAHSEHLSAGWVAGATCPLKKTKGSASSHGLMSVMQL